MNRRLKRIWTLATATMTQLVRMKILIFLVIACALIVMTGFAFSVMNPEQQLKLLKDVSLGALQLFSMVIAVVATALLLPKDLEDRTLYTILSKPVPRLDYLLGKLLGMILLIGIGLAVLDAAFCLVLFLREKMVLAQMMAELQSEGRATPETLAQLKDAVAKQGLNGALQVGVLAIFLKACILSAMTLMISCLASSTLFTVIAAFCLTIIGHGHELLRDYFLDGKLPGLVEKVISILLATLTPDFGNFDIIDNVLSGASIAWSSIGIMVGLTLLYLTGYLVLSQLMFVEKEL
jgi:hypothetical protein